MGVWAAALVDTVAVDVEGGVLVVPAVTANAEGGDAPGDGALGTPLGVGAAPPAPAEPAAGTAGVRVDEGAAAPLATAAADIVGGAAAGGGVRRWRLGAGAPPPPPGAAPRTGGRLTPTTPAAGAAAASTTATPSVAGAAVAAAASVPAAAAAATAAAVSTAATPRPPPIHSTGGACARVASVGRDHPDLAAPAPYGANWLCPQALLGVSLGAPARAAYGSLPALPPPTPRPSTSPGRPTARPPARPHPSPPSFPPYPHPYPPAAAGWRVAAASTCRSGAAVTAEPYAVMWYPSGS